MHDADPIDALGLDCPEGGDFWICATKPTRFIGCCRTNPCETDYGLCPDEDLEPATFDPRAYGLIPEQGCISDNLQVEWYTCVRTKALFLGCCAVDACEKGGCPAQSLRAARLSDVVPDADRFLDGDATSTTEASTLTMTSTSFSATGTADSPRPSPKTGSGPKLSGGEIAAAVLGCAIFLCGLLWVFIKLYRGGRDRYVNGNAEQGNLKTRAITQATVADVPMVNIRGDSQLNVSTPQPEATTQPPPQQQSNQQPLLNVPAPSSALVRSPQPPGTLQEVRNARMRALGQPELAAQSPPREQSRQRPQAMESAPSASHYGCQITHHKSVLRKASSPAFDFSIPPNDPAGAKARTSWDSMQYSPELPSGMAFWEESKSKSKGAHTPRPKSAQKCLGSTGGLFTPPTPRK
ncbi:hypothetical protein QQZ08_011809 [Neonectria magnoliae]|uniref:Uncharacterized protein n=1 Tax=Neonectria magnoliae TaxID=2732573 RepID=A0ABR1H718_9HYPO